MHGKLFFLTTVLHSIITHIGIFFEQTEYLCLCKPLDVCKQNIHDNSFTGLGRPWKLFYAHSQVKNVRLFVGFGWYLTNGTALKPQV